MPKQKIRRIFVVDDEEIIAETLAFILRNNGYSARFFLNPLETLQMSLSEAPDLLISDVTMPQLSGIDLAIRMKERCPMCKILLFSAQAGTSDLLAGARKQGHDFYLHTDRTSVVTRSSPSRKTVMSSLGTWIDPRTPRRA